MTTVPPALTPPLPASSDINYLTPAWTPTGRTSIVSRKWNNSVKDANHCSKRSGRSTKTSNGSSATSSDFNATSTSDDEHNHQVSASGHSGGSSEWSSDETSPPPPSNPVSNASATTKGGRRRRAKQERNQQVHHGTTAIENIPTRRTNELRHVFPELTSVEVAVDDYSCALKKEILLQGRMYLTQYSVCFHSSIFSFETRLVIPISSILRIEKRKMVFFNNAIELTVYDPPLTESPLHNHYHNLRDSRKHSPITSQSNEIKEEYIKTYFFASFLGRDAAYETMMTLWRLQKNAPVDYSVEVKQKEIRTNENSTTAALGAQPSTREMVDVPHHINDVNSGILNYVTLASDDEFTHEQPISASPNSVERKPSSPPYTSSIPFIYHSHKPHLQSHQRTSPVVSTTKVRVINNMPVKHISTTTALWLLLIVCVTMALSSCVVLMRVRSVVDHLEGVLPEFD